MFTMWPLRRVRIPGSTALVRSTMIYTAEPGTEDAERLELITVLGTQTLVG
jgi:hypothetical protein